MLLIIVEALTFDLEIFCIFSPNDTRIYTITSLNSSMNLFVSLRVFCPSTYITDELPFCSIIFQKFLFFYITKHFFYLYLCAFSRSVFIYLETSNFCHIKSGPTFLWSTIKQYDIMLRFLVLFLLYKILLHKCNVSLHFLESHIMLLCNPSILQMQFLTAAVVTL